MLQLKLRSRAKGQSISLVALLAGVGMLFLVVAIAVDGGGALLQRRNMQNSADSAALGAVQALQASIIMNGNQPTYSITNRQLVQRVADLVSGNYNGAIGQSGRPVHYISSLEYGTFNGSGYDYTTVATCRDCGSNWTWSSDTLDAYVANTVDAIRITAHVDNPTTLGALARINYIPVEAKAAAAIQVVQGYTASGPSWPMTLRATPTPTPGADPPWCEPQLFWSNAGSQFRNLIQLGGSKGKSYENNTSYNHFSPQLIQAPDPRGPMPDATGNGQYYTNCNGNAGFEGPPGLWSPAGNCTATVQCDTCAVANNWCCSGSASASSTTDIQNWITNDWMGSMSATEHWDRSTFNSYPPSDTYGDWPEVYAQGTGNQGCNIACQLQAYIAANGRQDSFFQWYGKYVDKVMYIYDKGQIYTDIPCVPNGCTPVGQAWQQINLDSDQPQRVHISQVTVFRFYAGLAGTNGNVARPPMCSNNQPIKTNNGQTWGVYVGQEVQQPPPSPGPHGRYNFVGFIDP